MPVPVVVVACVGIPPVWTKCRLTWDESHRQKEAASVKCQSIPASLHGPRTVRTMQPSCNQRSKGQQAFCPMPDQICFTPAARNEASCNVHRFSPYLRRR